MQKLRSLARALWGDQRGVTTVEYAVVLCLVAILGIAGWKSFGNKMKSQVEKAGTTIGKLPTGG